MLLSVFVSSLCAIVSFLSHAAVVSACSALSFPLLFLSIFVFCHVSLCPVFPSSFSYWRGRLSSLMILFRIPTSLPSLSLLPHLFAPPPPPFLPQEHQQPTRTRKRKQQLEREGEGPKEQEEQPLLLLSTAAVVSASVGSVTTTTTSTTTTQISSSLSSASLATLLSSSAATATEGADTAKYQSIKERIAKVRDRGCETTKEKRRARDEKAEKKAREEEKEQHSPLVSFLSSSPFSSLSPLSLCFLRTLLLFIVSLANSRRNSPKLPLSGQLRPMLFKPHQWRNKPRMRRKTKSRPFNNN